MLTELRIRDLGVIADTTLVLDGGMTAVTGETGAGKTMIVEAVELLVGGRADPVLVRPGAVEAWVEGRFVVGDEEVVLARAVPASGRSRAYLDGRMVPVGALAEAGAELVDLHGQHAHQSLLSASSQRAALDTFASVDHGPRRVAVDRLRSLDEELTAAGGDPHARAREVDLLRFQVAELKAAALADPGEEAALAAEEDVLACAAEHREAALAAHAALAGDGAASDALGQAVAAVSGRSPFAELEARLRGLAAELAEAASDIRTTGEHIDEDPERLAAVRSRRQLLRDLCRKYGDTLADVIAFAVDAERRLADLEAHDQRAAELQAERESDAAVLAGAERAIGAARRNAAPALAASVEWHLRELAMAKARFEVAVGGEDAGDDVTFLLSANAGEPLLPLSKVASGGELARAMLGARLVLAGGAPTMVFDEVDAGIGGEAAVAVGRSLAALAAAHQVLVVTHLPQVAAFADHQVVVTKDERDGRTVAEAGRVDGKRRVVELSRMLSGQPASATARDHAEELLAAAARQRGR